VTDNPYYFRKRLMIEPATTDTLLEHENQLIAIPRLRQRKQAADSDPPRARDQDGCEQADQREIELEAKLLTEEETVLRVNYRDRANHHYDQRGRREARQKTNGEPEGAKKLTDSDKVANWAHHLNYRVQAGSAKRAEKLLSSMSGEDDRCGETYYQQGPINICRIFACHGSRLH